ncbi:formimidoylglutamase [Rufibacter latericius]|uniref:Formimidoylglutamase n=1 Tax=Rufibacter latericius TaxID=2487040 RepID=A0A3M9M8Q8_9BACT|nr:formimidoylglutamase [Rufibacter latericius]RNI21949.1 formimidoylglutamase [Rufibacter latericius]
MYKPSDKTSWRGRTDLPDGGLGQRWHQVVQVVDLSSEIPSGGGNVAFLGFCCDEGVRRNQGRVGAAAGPDAIRQAMSPFAEHLPDGAQLFEAGDVICPNQQLEEAQVQLGRKVELLLKKGYRPLLLGGGHETAYGHFLGIRTFLKEGEKLGIINFDAHFDLRSVEPFPSSGTPFLQIAQDLEKAGQPFHYFCLGIQEYGNTRKLFQTADQLGAEYITAQALQSEEKNSHLFQIKSFIQKVDRLYVSIDLDVFAAAFAPGVSAPTSLGLFPQDFLPLLREILNSGKVLSMDVVELNPIFDSDHRTAKLAASLIYQMVEAWR